MANFSRKSFKNWTKNKASLDISLKTEFEELTNCFKWNSKETPQIGAAFDSDKFTLPKPFPWCQKNLAGLITGGYFLPVEERNILLTGNPRLKFDTYILVYSLWKQQLILQNFQRILQFEQEPLPAPEPLANPAPDVSAKRLQLIKRILRPPRSQ